MTWFSTDPVQSPEVARRQWERYFADHPVIAEINLLAAVLMETIGPMLWAALILLSLWAGFFEP
jgi:hypothetical protein